MGEGVAILVVLACLLVAGVVLVVLGIRGSRLTPYDSSRACGFNLSGLEAGTCPECGANLMAARARRRVSRRRRPGRAAAGIGLILAALVVPAGILADGLAAGKLSASMPTWALTLELQCLGSRTPKLVADELLSRCVKGNVSDSALRAAATAATRMRTGDESLPLSLNQLVGDAATRGLISKDLLARHMVVPLMLEADVPARVRVGDPVVNTLINITGADARTPPDGTWIIGRRITGIEVDGVLTPARTVQSRDEAAWAPALILTPRNTTYVQRPGPQDVVAVPVQPRLAVGKHTVRLHFCVDVFKGTADKEPGRAAVWRDYPVEVVAADGPLVTLVDDPGFRSALAERLTPSVVRRPGGASWDVSVKPGATVPALPSGVTVRSGIGGAWEVIVEINGERQKPGKVKVVWDADGDVHPLIFFGPKLRLPADAETCRVLLVPDERYAAQRTAVDVMPAGEIVFDNVLIR